MTRKFVRDVVVPKECLKSQQMLPQNVRVTSNLEFFSNGQPIFQTTVLCGTYTTGVVNWEKFNGFVHDLASEFFIKENLTNGK